MKIIVRTPSGSVNIDDLLGMYVDTTAVDLLDEFFDISSVMQSDHLKELVSNGDIIVNDGTDDLNISDGLDHLDLLSEYEIGQIQGATGGTGGTGAQGLPGSGGTGSFGDIPCLQIRRTTDYNFTSSWVDITFDTTDVENNSDVIEHDDINTDRILIKEDGNYEINFGMSIEYVDNAKFQSQIRKNDSSVIPGSLMSVVDDNDTAECSNSFIATLSSGDFITLQLGFIDGTPGEGTAKADIIITIFKLQGTKGETGGTGSAGGPTGGSGGTGASGMGDGGSSGPLSCVQVRRSTAYTLTSSYEDVTFDVTDEETDDTIIEHNDSNTERIDIKEDGAYLIIYDFGIDPTSLSQWHPCHTNGQVKKNGSTVLYGSHSKITVVYDDSIDNSPYIYNPLHNSFVASLSDGDYITLQLKYESDEGDTLINGTFKVIKLEGGTGGTGDSGGPTGGTGGTGSSGTGGSEFGSEFDENSSDGQSSTTSTSYQQKLKVNAENLPAGKYVIFWSFEFSS